MPIPIQLPSIPGKKWFDPLPTKGAEVVEGDAVNSSPFEARERLDITTPVGVWSGICYSLLFQFPRWGFVRFKIDEWIAVSPVFREYYDITIRQKEQLEGIIKNGLTSITTAASDMELLWHDLRKYKEHMEHFHKIEKGKWLTKHGKQGEGEKLMMEGEQTLKAIFIDEVDVHTGEMISLKSIAPRWPTIIADFMDLKDNDTNPKEISKKLKVSEAEGVVLATKNKLYVEWRDKIFRDTVYRRYEILMGLLESRKTSFKEYKEMLRPTLARYKMINDALSSPELRKDLLQAAVFKSDAQAVSNDFMRVWAWKPFSPREKYQMARTWLHNISLSDTGFTREEIQKLGEMGVKDKELFGLPVEPAIDHVIRKIKDVVEREYQVEITIKDIFDARQMLAKQFQGTYGGFGGREPWIYSPYFIHVDIPMYRTVWRLADGSEFEDVQMEDIIVSARSQNFIIINCLELIAKQKKLDNYIDTMLGDVKIKDETGKIQRTVPIAEMMKEEYPEVFIKDEKELESKLKALEKLKESAKRVDDSVQKMKERTNRVLDTLGLGGIKFFKATGPYEFAVVHRMAKTYHTVVGPQHKLVLDFMKSKAGVPGFTQVLW